MTSESQGTQPHSLPVVFLRDRIVFPGIVAPVDIVRSSNLAVADLAGGEDGLLFAFVTQTDAATEDPKISDVFPMAVEAEVMRITDRTATSATLVAGARHRIRILELSEADGVVRCRFEPVEEIGADTVEARGLAMAVRDLAKELIALMPNARDEISFILDRTREPGQLADLVTVFLDCTIAEQMDLLTTLDVPSRLQEVLDRLRHDLETRKVQEQIRSQVQTAMGRQQHEFMLRQRMSAIRGQLGESDEDDEVAELADRIDKADMPSEVEAVAQKQLARLQHIPVQSPEHTVARTYLECLVDLPWSKTTEDHLDLLRARRILDEDHYGLAKIKQRIIEYVAVRRLKPDKKGPILCLVGPPGVGKTSTGRSVARALGREFVRASLGGVHDEAEIRGHRRTYIGAQPGRIIQGIRRAGTRNPVFVLDEIDKLGTGFRGDPSSALLEVLDAEHNHTFSDHYLEVPFDLSQVLFFTTANQADVIPAGLRDRMEVLELHGYTRNEKLFIAKEHLLPKQVEEHGLTIEQVPMHDEAIFEGIDSYTREAGVRNLERELANVCRSVAVLVGTGHPSPVQIERSDLNDLLGPIKFSPEVAERTGLPGVAASLAWTPVGGRVQFVEATRMSGQGRLILTGNLGKVMQESALTALSFTRTSADLELDPDFYQQSDFHIHLPAGAMRKDGPSAGAAMMVALVSLLTGRRVRDDVAITGEISLRGRVLPVGGVKEKVLAAHRVGIRRVIIPHLNRKDLVEIPEEVQQETEITLVRKASEVLELALWQV